MIRAAFFYHKCAVNLFCKYKSDELVRIGYCAEAKREVAFVKQLLRKSVRSAYNKRYCRHAVFLREDILSLICRLVSILPLRSSAMQYPLSLDISLSPSQVLTFCIFFADKSLQSSSLTSIISNLQNLDSLFAYSSIPSLRYFSLSLPTHIIRTLSINSLLSCL